jgi:hypothetical protein
MHMTARKSITFPVVLKTIISDVHRDNKSFTLNDKQIRSRLRAKVPAHIRNTSWVANNQRDYDAIRSAFDCDIRREGRQTRTRSPRCEKGEGRKGRRVTPALCAMR